MWHMWWSINGGSWTYSNWIYCSKTSRSCSEPEWPTRPHLEATTKCPNFLLISQQSSVIVTLIARENWSSLQDPDARLSNSTLWSKRTWLSSQQRDKHHCELSSSILVLPLYLHALHFTAFTISIKRNSTWSTSTRPLVHGLITNVFFSSSLKKKKKSKTNPQYWNTKPGYQYWLPVVV